MEFWFVERAANTTSTDTMLETAYIHGSLNKANQSYDHLQIRTTK